MAARGKGMDILAVYPRDPDLRYFEKMPPLGMLWLGGELGRAGYGLEFVDQQVDAREPARVAEELRPRLALIGGTSHSRFASFDAASRIKEVSPHTTVVYGGPHATFTADDTLQNIPAIDIVARGEGEKSCAELAEWAESGGRPEELSHIKGISYRHNGATIHNPPRRPLEDLDALGAPARDLVPMGRYEMKMEYLDDVPGASIMTARGCPIGCTFCSASAMFGSSYRARSPAAVGDELEDLITNHGARGIKIFDSTFTLSRRHVEGFCAELKRRGINVPWECEIRVDNVDKELLARMQEAGCYYVDVGVEAGSQRVLDACVRKKITLAAAVNALRWCAELGLLTKVFFTLGHPGETYGEARETNRFIRRHRKYVRLFGYHAGVKVYPGTYVEKYAWDRGLMPPGFRWSAPYVNEGQRRLFRPPDNIPILLQPGLGLDELRRLRIGFILMRMSSPRFVWEKIGAVVKGGAARKYSEIVGKGVFRGCH
jgi:anaerobic magnesium-protoporphyrin IX monomethyl ester cyclase